MKRSNLKGTINVCKADFHELEKYYSADEFDAVFFLESLTHSHNPQKAVQSVRNIIKKRGTIYIKDLYRGPDNPNMKSQIDYPIEAIERQFCLKIRPVGEIIDILSECGFELAFCKRLEVEANFDVGNNFTAKHLFKLLKDQDGAWVDRGMVFLNWLEIKAMKHY
ncbi:methyltransferase domain-containing protein [Microcoleus sp. ARI1-B5]|uniref:methyltransferase domain-containing protein n=1 Tax=unclassified Microcoleus TaxID=2642155 RepID=UPI002FD64BC3